MSKKETTPRPEAAQETTGATEAAAAADDVESGAPEAGAATDASTDTQTRLAEAEARAEDNWNQYLRAMAEMENLRKRAQRDVEQARKFAVERFAGELLNVRDSLEMGLAAASEAQGEDQVTRLREGKEMTLKQLDGVFEKFGLEVIDPVGAVFNPELHEAMAMQPSAEHKPDTVISVVQKGYLLNGRLLRPARVLVARAPDTEGGDSSDQN